MAGDAWDPLAHQDPVRVLTQRIREMPVGHHMRLADGTVIKSVRMKHGASQVRRFQVAPQGGSVPRGISLGNSHSTAEKAAQAALKGKAT